MFIYDFALKLFNLVKDLNVQQAATTRTTVAFRLIIINEDSAVHQGSYLPAWRLGFVWPLRREGRVTAGTGFLTENSSFTYQPGLSRRLIAPSCGGLS